MAANSPWACASVTPGFRRPITPRFLISRRGSSVATGSCSSGIQRSSLFGNCMSGAITPTMVTTLLLALIVRPRTVGSPPYRFFHMPLVRIATGSAPFLSSASVNARPRTGRSPIIGNNVDEI